MTWDTSKEGIPIDTWHPGRSPAFPSSKYHGPPIVTIKHGGFNYTIIIYIVLTWHYLCMYICIWIFYISLFSISLCYIILIINYIILSLYIVFYYIVIYDHETIEKVQLSAHVTVEVRSETDQGEPASRKSWRNPPRRGRYGRNI